MCEREREIERERVYVRMYDSERQRERERERVYVRMYDRDCVCM